VTLDPLGTSAGTLSMPTTSDLKNELPTIPDVPVDPTSGRVQPRDVASGVTRGIQQLGSDKIYSDGGNNQVIVEDATTPRVLIGNQTTFGEGLFVSKAGINAKTNTDAGQWIFNSNQDTFKIVQDGTATIPSITVNVGDTHKSSSVVIPLSPVLTFTPAILVYVYDSVTQSYKLMAGDSTDSTVNTYSSATAITNIVFERYTFYSQPSQISLFHDIFVTGPSPPFSAVAGAIPIKYFVLQETVSS
jgi:hypothetical protein